MPYKPMRFITACRELYLRMANIRHKNWGAQYTVDVYGSKEERAVYENRKISRFNRRSAFMHKTHLDVNAADVVFDTLPLHEQSNWAQNAS